MTSSSSAKNRKHVSCEDCELDDLCRPISMGSHTLPIVHEIMGRQIPIKDGDSVFQQHEPFTHLYAVTSGIIKLVSNQNTSQEQVLGFRFPGELIGEEAISPRTYTLTAVAISNVSVCRIPMKELDALTQEIPSIKNSLNKLIQRQCYLLHQQLASYVGKNNAESRVAAFLINLAERNSVAKDSDESINFAINRDDIANFLGLRRETLSRTMTKLQKEGLIAANRKTLRILNHPALESLMQT